MKRTVNGATTVYVYDASGQLAQEYGAVVAAAGPSGRSYLFTDARAGASHLGSTRLQVADNGVVQGWWDYTPFGEFIPGTVGGRASVSGFRVWRVDHFDAVHGAGSRSIGGWE